MDHPLPLGATNDNAERTVDWYVDRAREALETGSDRAVGRALAVTPAVVHYWRTKRSWPSDDVMLRLAAIAGVPADVALADLNSWRSEGETQAVYRRMASQMARALAMAGAVAVLAMLPSKGTEAAQVGASVGGTVYYVK